MTWIEELKLSESIKSIREEMRKGDILPLDPLRFDDLANSKVKDILERDVKEKLRSNKYIAQGLIRIDSPKRNYLLRSGARPALIDWIVYDALTNYIVRKIYKKIPSVNFSFQQFRELQTKRTNKHKSITYWVAFDDRAEEFAKKASFMLVTDITSFFDHISLDVLKVRLKMLNLDKQYEKAVNYLIENILKVWAEDSKVEGLGLPQGLEASRLLADIYLYPLDLRMKKTQSGFIRYRDDMRLFAKTKSEIKVYIGMLTKELRDLGLDLNSKKTEIIFTENGGYKKVFDPRKEVLNKIEKAIQSRISKDIQKIKPDLRKIKAAALEESGGFTDRYMRFYISHTIDLMKLRLVRSLSLKNEIEQFILFLDEMPHFTGKFCWFFVMCSQYDSSLRRFIRERLINFICDKKRNIYPWQEMWVLDTIRQLGPTKRSDFLKIGRYVNKESSPCLAQYLVIVQQSGGDKEKEEVLILNPKGQDLYRAVGLAVQGLSKDVLDAYKISFPEYFDFFLKQSKQKYFGYSDNLEHWGFQQNYGGSGKDPVREIQEGIRSSYS